MFNIDTSSTAELVRRMQAADKQASKDLRSGQDSGACDRAVRLTMALRGRAEKGDRTAKRVLCTK